MLTAIAVPERHDDRITMIERTSRAKDSGLKVFLETRTGALHPSEPVDRTFAQWRSSGEPKNSPAKLRPNQRRSVETGEISPAVQ